MHTFTTQEAQAIGQELGINFEEMSLEEFRRGIQVELEHGARDPQTNITNNDALLTGKIAWAHLKEIPDYYSRLATIDPND